MSNAIETSRFRGRPLLGHTQINLAGLTTRNLSSDEQMYGELEFVGALTADCAVNFANIDGWLFWLFNNTSGDFQVTAKVPGQPGCLLPQGRILLVHGQGTDIKAVDTSRGERAPVVSISAAGGDVTLTPAQAAAGLVKLTSALADFSVIFPFYCVGPQDHVMFYNGTGFTATAKLGSGDQGIFVPPFAVARLIPHPTGAWMLQGLSSDGVAQHTPNDLGIGGALAGGFGTGGFHGLRLRRRTRTISGNTTLSATADSDALTAPFLRFNGALGADATVQFPPPTGIDGEWRILDNATTGGFSIIAKVVGDGGVGVTIPTATRAQTYATQTAMERVGANVPVTP